MSPVSGGIRIKDRQEREGEGEGPLWALEGEGRHRVRELSGGRGLDRVRGGWECEGRCEGPVHLEREESRSTVTVAPPLSSLRPWEKGKLRSAFLPCRPTVRSSDGEEKGRGRGKGSGRRIS